MEGVADSTGLDVTAFEDVTAFNLPSPTAHRSLGGDFYAPGVQQKDVAVKLSHDEALVLFEWLSRTDDLTNHFGGIVEDQAEQRALWNLTALLERAMTDPFRPEYSTLVERARARLRDGT